MSQNIIDVGAAPNDGTGDPLRNAFIAINENFDQIWSNGPVNSNVRIANNSITTTNINGNLVLAPSGIGITQVKSSIVPAVDNVYDLGSPSARFNTIYLGSGGLELAGNLNVDYYFGNGRFLSGVLAAAAPNIQFGGTTVNIPSANANVVFTVNNIQSLEVGAAQTIFFRPIVSNSTVSTSGNITSAANVNAVGISATTVAAAGLAVSANTTTGNLSVVGSVTANTVNSTGNITFAPGGNLVFSNAVVNWLANPVQAQDAATKFYVDSVAQGLDVKASVLLATATTLPTYVYNNGTDGVGATITATTNGLLSIDSTAVSANARVLVKNEVGLNQPYNGIYIVTNTGNATAQFVLTRSTDFDLPSEIPSAFTFIETGATNADTGYVCITNSPVTIGTTNIVWQQFSGAGSYTAGIGLSLNGTQFFISNTGVTANTYGSSSSIPVLTVDPRGQITNATTASINAPAGLVTGDTLSSNVLISSLTAVGTLSQLSVSGNVNANNLNSSQVVSAAGNVIGGNITTAGVLTASGNVVGGNISTAGLVTATGNIVGGNIATAGVITATGNVISAGNVNAANVNSSGNISAVGNVNSGNITTTGSITAAQNISATGNVSASTLNSSGLISAVGNVNTTANVNAGNINATGTISSTGNISATGNLQGNNLSVTNLVNASGNVTGANITTNGLITAVGNITSTSNVAAGNIVSQGLVTAVGNIVTSANVNAANLNVTESVVAVGNVVGGNLTTSGRVTATGNIVSSANISGGNLLSTGIVSATSNVIGGNITTGGRVDATGNITGGNLTTTGTANIATLALTGSATVAGSIAVSSSISASSFITATGNVTGGNLTTGGLISATGNITGGNITTTGTANIGTLAVTGAATVTGNVTGGNLITSGLVSATGNITAGNVLTGGLISATGNVTGNYFIGNGSQLTGIVSSYGNSNVTTLLSNLGSNTIGGTGNITTTANISGGNLISATLNNSGNISVVASGNTWTFGSTGNLTVPATNSVPGRISTQTTLASEKGFDLRISAGNTDGCSVPGGDLYLSTGVGYNGISHGAGNVNIVTGDRYGNINGNIWRFDSSGALTLPLGNIKIKGTVGNSIAFGLNAGQISQGNAAVAIGSLAGNNRQGNNSVAIGNTAGAGGSVSTNYVSGAESPSTTLVVTSTTGIGPGMIISGTGFFGNITVVTVTNSTTLEISASAGFTPSGTLTFTGSQGDEAVAIGQSAGSTNQGSGAVAVGGLAGYNLQGDNAVAIGGLAGNNSQGTQAVAVGLFAGQEDQGQFSVAIGGGAGQQTQGEESVAIGAGAGSTVQGNAAVAIGGGAGAANQRINSVAIGASAGAGTQGQYAVAIGASAGYTNQGNNSIILNATGANLDQTTANTFTVAPVRNDVANTAQVMFYNTTSKEITYGNTISVAGNITSGNLNSPTLNNSGNVSVVAGGNTWTFGTNGNLTVPGPISGLGFSKLDFTTYGANSAYLTTTADDTTALFMGAVTAELYANTDVSIRANTGGTSQNWIFGQDGALTAPGNLNGVNVNTGIVSATGNVNSGNVNTAKVASTGGITIASGGSSDITLNAAGNINADSNYINNLLDPMQNQDAATKIYVDNLVATGLTYHEQVFVSTTANLATTTGGTITYAQPNGAGNGIGATITTTGSFNLIDTANVQTIGTRILVKNEGNAVLNGVYTWSNATAITRSTDADEYGTDSAHALSLNSYFFTESGNVNKGSAYVVAEPQGTITFGTSNIVFDLFSTSQVYSANTQAGISLVGTVFSAKVDNNTTAFDGGGNISVKAGANLTTPNIGAATGTSLSVTGNVTAGNFNTVGAISASGNILSSNVFATGTVSGNIVTGNSVSASGNVTGANINTNGLISAAGNVISGNVSTGNIVAANVNTGYLLVNTSAGANITGGNLILTEVTGAGGAVSAQGNISGANLNATNISLTGNVLSNLRVNGNVNVSGVVDIANSLTADSLLVDTVGGITANSGNITINQITGQGGYLNAVGANLSANIVAGNVNTGNISLTGNVLSDLNVNGNVDIAGTVGVANSFTADSILVDTAGGITANGGNIVINQITGQGGYLNALGANLSANVIAGNVNTGNISLTGNVLSNLNVNGNASITGILDVANSITADSILVDTIGGITANGGNININQITGQGGNLNAVGISVSGNISGNNITLGNNLSTTGNITAGYFIGDGSQLTNVSIAAGSAIENGNSNVRVAANGNVSVGTYGTIPAVFANTGLYATGLISATGNVDVGSTLNVTSNAAITGNISGGNISASGNISGTYFLGNGSLLSGIITSVANINNGTSNLRIDTAGGNIQANVAGTANIFTINASGIQTSGNASANNLSISNVTNIGVLSVSGNITANGVVTVDGNVTAANLISNGTVSAQGNVIGGNINTAGVVSATGNVVSVANVSGGNILSSLLISAAGNVTGANITSNGAVIALGNVTGGNVNSDGRVSAAGNIVTTANVTGGNLLTSGVLNLTGGTPYNTATLSGGNIILNNGAGDTPGLHFYQGNNDNFGIDVEAGTLRFVKNLDEAGGSAVGRVDSNGNIIAVGQLQGASASVSGNVTGGNIITGGFISATGNITGNYFFGNGSQLSGIITSVANINNGTSNIRIETSGGNIQANVGGTANVWTLASTGEYVSGEISASGNITGNFFFGNGSQLSGIITSVANINNGNSNVRIDSSGGNVAANVGGTANVLVLANTGAFVTGVVSASGNITGNFFIGNGSQLTGIANASSVYSVISLQGNVAGNSAGNVTINAGNVSGTLIPRAGNGIGMVGNATTGVITISVLDSLNDGIFWAGNNSAGLVSDSIDAPNVDNGLVTDSTISNSYDLGPLEYGTSSIISANLIPDNPFVYTLGNTSFPFLSLSVADINSTGNITTTKNVSATGNITAAFFSGDGSALSNVSGSNIRSGNSNVSVTAANGNIALSVTGNSNAVVFAPGLTTFKGNLVPDASNIYSLGSSTLRWTNLWISGNTITLGNIVLNDDNATDFSVYTSNGTTPANVKAQFINTLAYGYNSANLSASGNVSNAFNALSSGPITINSEVTITVNSGAFWTIV